MDRLTVLFDESCGFCRECALWLARQSQLCPLQMVPMSEGKKRWPALGAAGSAGKDELLVLGDGGELWTGDAAFITCLWALDEYRSWSVRLAQPGLRGLARKGFELVSKKRHVISDWLGLGDDEEVRRALDSVVGNGTPRCSPRNQV